MESWARQRADLGKASWSPAGPGQQPAEGKLIPNLTFRRTGFPHLEYLWKQKDTDVVDT